MTKKSVSIDPALPPEALHSPHFSNVELADMIFMLETTIETTLKVLTATKASLKANLLRLKSELNPTPTVVGTLGQAYKLANASPSYEYKPEVLKFLEKLGLSEYFQSVSITRGVLETLRTQKKLSKAQIAQIEKWTIKTPGDVCLRRLSSSCDPL